MGEVVGAEELDVDSDWKKARAFLVAFSTAVLLAWYFSAELNSISLLGLSIKFKANAHNVWLVVAIINLYLLLRCIQKFPRGCHVPDDEMRRAFEATLILYSSVYYRRSLIDFVFKSAQDEPIADGLEIRKVKTISPFGSMKYRVDFDSSSPAEERESIEVYRRHSPFKIYYSLPFIYEAMNGGEVTVTGYSKELIPSRSLIVYCKVVGWLKGALFTPWMSDYILPILLGLSSFSAAIGSWLLINCFA